MTSTIIIKSGTVNHISGGGNMRTTMNSGGGNTTFAYVECHTNVILSLNGYGNSSRAYNYIGNMVAIQLR